MSIGQRITEYEYDKLPSETQRRYCYCPICNLFYLKTLKFCTHN